MFGIGMGPTKEQQNTFSSMNQLFGFEKGAGEGMLTESRNFWDSIMSGDPSKTMSVLSPQLAGLKDRAQQRKNQTAQFSARSGGTAAAMASVDEGVQSAIEQAINGLTGTGATQVGNMGMSLLGQASSTGQAAFGEASQIQQLQSAQWNDIFNSIGSVAGAAAGFFPGGSMMSKVLTGAQGTLGGGQ